MLRAAAREDIDARALAGRDPELVRGYGLEWSDTPYTREDAITWYERAARSGSWVVAVDGEAIGDCHLERDRLKHDCARFSIGLWSASRRSQGYGSEATRLVVDHGFRELGLHRIELRVMERNDRAIRAYARCGFVTEGIERETAFLDGAWQNDVIMSILRHEWES